MAYENATPRPWSVDKYGTVNGPDGEVVRANGFASVMAYNPAQSRAKDTSRLIVEAVNAYDDLKAESERLRALIIHFEDEARRYAGAYPQSSDGRNTFIMFADMIADRAGLSQASA